MEKARARAQSNRRRSPRTSPHLAKARAKVLQSPLTVSMSLFANNARVPLLRMLIFVDPIPCFWKRKGQTQSTLKSVQLYLFIGDAWNPGGVFVRQSAHSRTDGFKLEWVDLLMS
jgi:hypothetical protein